MRAGADRTAARVCSAHGETLATERQSWVGAQEGQLEGSHLVRSAPFLVFSGVVTELLSGPPDTLLPLVVDAAYLYVH